MTPWVFILMNIREVSVAQDPHSEITNLFYRVTAFTYGVREIKEGACDVRWL